MSNAADRFKHRLGIMLRDTIKPEISEAWNTLLDESTNPSAELKKLGEWAAERLKQVVDLTAEIGESEQAEIMSFVQSKMDRGAFDD